MSWCVECRKDNGFCIYCQKDYKRLHGHIQRVHPDTVRSEACPIKTYDEWKATV